MVDSRAKGARFENNVKTVLKNKTKLDWQRVPLSGALEFAKGDLFLPHVKNIYTIECKHFKDEHLNSTILTSVKSQLEKWWEQAAREANQMKNKPLLIFKKDRGKLFCGMLSKPQNTRYIYISTLSLYISLLEEWIDMEEIVWKE